MPIITNFGDVVTVGNAAVNGTGTSSFAGPVSFAQGVSITGAVSTTSAFYGVLAGANTAAVSALTASTNVYAPVITTPVSNAATAIATTGFYGALVGQNVASVTVLTASGNVNAPTVNVTSLNVSTQANVTFLNVSSSAFLSNANVLTANITSANVLSENVSTLNVSGLATLLRMNVVTANITSSNVLTENVATLNVSGLATLSQANVLTANITSANVTTGNVTSLNVSGTTFMFSTAVATLNVTSANILTENVTSLNVSGTAFLSNANVATLNVSFANVTSLNVTGDANVANVTVRSNLYTSNIIMSSNLSTNTGYGNVYLTGNLVVQGNIFSIGGSVGSGSGTSQGILYSLPGTYSLGTAFATGTAGPGIAGYHINMASFSAEAVASVSAFSASTGMLKFATGGLYQVTCVVVGDQPVVKLAFGKTSSSSFPPVVTATAGYDYVYNFPVGSSPSTVITIPLTVQDVTQYYYLDVFFSTAAGNPTILYPTRSTSAVGSAYGTYVQVGPFGNYLTSATGVASGLLMNAYGTTTLSSPVTSNTFRLAMTSSNGWTVNGVSTALTVTSGGNFQANQVGIYEVSMCLNTSVTPMMFGVGSLAADAAPLAQGPYIYQYAPMYTQDPTTIVTMPLNITDTSRYYYIDVIFPGTQSTVALSNVSTFVSLKPVGSYVSPSTNPWSQQGTSVYYTGGAVGIGGVNPSLLTETFTVNGNTAFVGNVTVTSDASGNAYVLADRVPTGSLHVSSYVTGSVPLTTTTSLIDKYLATVSIGTQNSNVAVILPGVPTSNVFLGPNHSVLTNLGSSNIFMEAWVFTASGPGAGAVLLKQGTDWNWEAKGAGPKMTFDVNGLSTFGGDSTTNVPAGWVHLALSYVASTKTKYYFLNGTADGLKVAAGGTAAFTSTAAISIGSDLSGAIRDIRVMKGSIVPVTTFVGGAQAAPFTTAPTYVTGMNTGYTSNLALALNSQYFPGTSTSPYGPCLTLPGTVGSYYSTPYGFSTNWFTNGFCLEAWVNFASFANSNLNNGGAFSSFMVGHMVPTSAYDEWSFGPLTTGQVGWYWYDTTWRSLQTSSTITTGSWNHLMVQSNGSNVYVAVNGVFQTLTGGNFTPAGGSGTIAPSGPASTPTASVNAPITVGQGNSQAGPNFAIAKARLVFGNDTSAGSKAAANVYSSGNFTPNPNFAPVPAGATVAWQLESQYPLPTYPSFFDVPVLSAQTPAYGAEPVPVGGVTSNVLSPYSTTYPQLDSIRFDGTGYIDYGNAASSVMNSNLWASPWTIEGWVYPTSFSALQPIVFRTQPSTLSYYDFGLFLNQTTGIVQFNCGNLSGSSGFVSGSALPLNTWTHIAVTWDGSKSNIYQGTSGTSTTVASNAVSLAGYQTFNPTHNTTVGAWQFGPGSLYFTGNLADVRVSNTAIYTGSSYTVPSAPLPVLSSTMLLLRSLGGQVGTTLEVQGRGLNSTSIGATQTVRAYPPAPMSSYLLDTTSNASVTYGQGKYIASASSEFSLSFVVWQAFDGASSEWATSASRYNTSSPYNYIGSVTTVDTLGNVYAGEWAQIQLPVSVVLTSYYVARRGSTVDEQTAWWLLGSRDGTNWYLLDTRIGIAASAAGVTYTTSTTQAYTFFRYVMTTGNGSGQPGLATLTLNGTEESLCITSDAKVGVGIANPQRALEVAGDLVVSGTISGGAGLGSFRNRIINGDMRIAQRGVGPTAITFGSSVYQLDRFCMSSAAVSTGGLTQSQQTLVASDTPYQLGFTNSWKMTVTSPLVYSYMQPNHNIEGYNIRDLNWGTSFGSPVTISFWFRANHPTGSLLGVTLRNLNSNPSYVAPFTVTNSGYWQFVSFTVPPPPNGSTWYTDTNAGVTITFGGYQTQSPVMNSWQFANYVGPVGGYNWFAYAGNYIEFTGVQLERGTVATPFEARPFAQELALCQRYYYATSPGTPTGGAVGTVADICWTTSGTFNTGIRLPVPMRTSAWTLAIYNNGVANQFRTSVNGIAVVHTGTLTLYGNQSTTGVGGFYYSSGTELTAGARYDFDYVVNAEL